MEMLLGGEWVAWGKTIEVRDPFDDQMIDTVPAAGREEVETALRTAAGAAAEAAALPAWERSRILYGTVTRLEDQAEDFVQLLARESSKTVREARKEVRRCIHTLRSSAEAALRVTGETLPFDSFPGGEARHGWFDRVPVGVVVAITPFNDPLNLVAHKLGPALAAGNTVILKPATLTPLSALRLAGLLLEEGLPPRMLQVLTGWGADIGDPLVSDPRVRMVSFTGGVEAGLQITRKAGIKRLGMELGSNSPVIVWADADLEWAAESCVSGAFWAAGQNCIGVQRIYIHQERYETFREAFVARTLGYRIGDKLDETTDMGPMITVTEAERVERWVAEAVAAGARVLCGGGRDRALMEPTVLEDVPDSVRLGCDEVFGPTVNLYPVASEEEALARANGTDFGLHAAVFTRDVDTAFRLSRGLVCGGVMVNESTDYRLDTMPFGGLKHSGLGREGVRFAIEEMTEPKVTCFHLPPRKGEGP